MLEMRPNCQCCDRDLPPDAEAARICSLECTYCEDCADNILGGVCPGCQGELLPRPRRPDSELAAHPASLRRVLKPEGCGQAGT
jgi:uncharacterized protein